MIEARRSRGPVWPVVLGVSYPRLAHVSVVTRSPELVAASVGLLCALLLLEPLKRRRAWAWLTLAACCAALSRLVESRLATLPPFAPPVLITGGVAWMFIRTLREGATPLVEQIARLLDGPDLGPEQVAYARRLTALWALLTGTLCVINLGLALLVTPSGLLLAGGLRPPFTVRLETWSLFANVINYVVLGAMFALEFAYRRHRFPSLPRRGFVGFIRDVVRLGPLFARQRQGS